MPQTAPCYPVDRKVVGPTAGLDVVVKREKSLHYSCQVLNSGHPAHSLVTILTELPQLHFILNITKKKILLKTLKWNDFT
jgi:hypothetical protein